MLPGPGGREEMLLGPGEREEVQLGLDWCPACRLARPPRAGHCRICGVCVRRLDHHCVWWVLLSTMVPFLWSSSPFQAAISAHFFILRFYYRVSVII